MRLEGGEIGGWGEAGRERDRRVGRGWREADAHVRVHTVCIPSHRHLFCIAASVTYEDEL